MKALSFITIILFLLCCFTSCDAPENIHDITAENDVTYCQPMGATIRVKTITIDSIPHQYLFYYINTGIGLTHYPECKYCKENGQIK